MAAAQATDPALENLLRLLAKVEKKHMEHVLEILPPDAPMRQNPPAQPEDPAEITMEGGMSVDAFMKANTRYLKSPAGVLDLAMTIETRALDLYRSEGARIDLVLLDVIMPGMSGTECERQLRELDPDVRVLFSSGYSRGLCQRAGLEVEGEDFLPKPYDSGSLLRSVRGVLDSPPACPLTA
jgi:CheY-like chemotaxis protein